MIKLVRQIIVNICLSSLVFPLIFWPFNLDLNALTINENDKLIGRMTKDFSKKFCNGIGFGLSKESAMNFAMKENMATFKNKKGIESIDNKALAEKISSSVVDKCGFVLNLSGEEWGNNLKE